MRLVLKRINFYPVVAMLILLSDVSINYIINLIHILFKLRVELFTNGASYVFYLFLIILQALSNNIYVLNEILSTKIYNPHFIFILI